jgi:outer membrane protein TolC
MVFTGNYCIAQSLAKMPDSVRNRRAAEHKAAQTVVRAPATPDTAVAYKPKDETAIKDSLVKLALKNPLFTVADANITIAELNRKKANSAWLSSISAGANINEFVIQGSAAASFFPKYNLGIAIPFDIIQKNKLAKSTADQTIIINEALKAQQANTIRAEVLTRYENYKEKKQLVELQKISMENDLSAYESAQQDYADGVMKLAEMNKVYQSYVGEKSKLVSREKELNVAVIQLEEMIGVPLDSVL